MSKYKLTLERVVESPLECMLETYVLYSKTVKDHNEFDNVMEEYTACINTWKSHKYTEYRIIVEKLQEKQND